MATYRIALVVALVSFLPTVGYAGDDDAPMEAMRVFFSGEAERENGRLVRAILRYDAAIALHPTYTSAFVARATAREALGLETKALADYEAALKHDPKHVNALLGRARMRDGAGLLALAAEDLTRVLEIEPKNERVLNLRARIRMRLKDYAGAEEDLKRAIHLAPGSAEHRRQLGLVLAAQGKTDEAIRVFQEATQLLPKDAHLWYLLGVMQAAEGEVEAALAAYEQAIQRSPKDARPHAAMGAALASEGRWLDALGALGKAFELDPSAMHNVPDSVLLRTLRAVVMMDGERLAQADVTLEIAILLDAKAVRPHLLRYAIAVRLGREKEGAKVLQTWLDMREGGPDDPALDRIARYLVGRVQEDVLTKRAKPGDAVWYYVGLQRELKGDAKGAREAYARGAEAKPARCPEAVLSRRASTPERRRRARSVPR